MRKVDPQSVRDQFHAEADDLITFIQRIGKTLSGSAHSELDISRLASTTFLTLYVSFERFQSDLFLAYLNRDFSQFQAFKESSIRSSVRHKFGSWLENRLKFARVAHIAIDELEGVVDPDGWNLTFRDVSEMKQRATNWLAGPHASRLNSLSAADDHLVDTAKSIRNFIAHESPSAKRKMNEKLASVNNAGGNGGLVRGGQNVHKVGAYLKAVKSGDRRIKRYADRLKNIAVRM